MFTEQDVRSALERNPRLNTFGYDVSDVSFKDKRVSTCESRREDLAGMLDRVNACAEWIQSNITPTNRLNKLRTAYGIKHITEREIGYIPQGVFILAAILCGYRQEEDCDSAVFNMSEKSIRVAERRVNGL